MNRVKEIQDKEKAPSLNVEASKRFVKSALWKAAQAKQPVDSEGIHRFRYTKNFSVKIVNKFFPINFNICFWRSKEPSHRDGSFEYPKHMFWLRNKKIKYSLRTLN